MAVAMMALLPTEMYAQQVCAQRAEVLAQLRMRYMEKILWIGVTSNGRGLMELHGAPNGSWSMTVTDTMKITCIVAAGDGWSWGPYGERA